MLNSREQGVPFYFGDVKMNGLMETNLDRIFTEPPQRRCRNKEEQQEIWKEKLEGGLRDEQCSLLWLKYSIDDMVFWEDTLNRLNHWERVLKHHVNRIDSMFFDMHYVAYFDGLLGGTGISKEVTETEQTLTDYTSWC